LAEVVFSDVTKRFGNFTAVNDISMVIEDGTFTVLVGPSGCGKTTTLRMVAGLDEITAGEIRIGEQVVNHVPPKDRDIAMVFQDYALYPHMDVYNNLAFGLKLRKYSKDHIDRRVHEAAELLGIEEKLKSKPRELSGGERQRVAVGRAIVRHPSVFLFDEPLSNLDAKLRAQMRAELKELHRKLQTTTLYVTHDQVEAMTMGDRIAVMRDGVIQQYAPPREMYDHPSNQFVAGFIGSPSMNFLPAGTSIENGRTILAGDGFRIMLPAERSVPRLPERVILGVRPQDLEGPVPDGEDGVTFTVALKEQLGHSLLVYGTIEESPIIASLDPHSVVEVDRPIHLRVNPMTLHVFDPETARTLI
jgi:multiple sugar transport system ATP-binding protein